MTTRCTVWVVTLVVLGLVYSCNGLAGQADDGGAAPTPTPPIGVTVTINPDLVVGPLPKVFRPSVMLTGSSEEAKMAFLELPGKLGTIRWGLGQILEKASGPDEFLGALEGVGPGGKRFEERGAQLVITMEGMPKWLASRQESEPTAPYGWPIYRASPPRDLKAYEQFVYDTVRILNGTYGLKPFYEFWNEPNSRMFWVGTQQELFKTYAAFAAGARRADPRVLEQTHHVHDVKGRLLDHRLPRHGAKVADENLPRRRIIEVLQGGESLVGDAHAVHRHHGRGNVRSAQMAVPGQVVPFGKGRPTIPFVDDLWKCGVVARRRQPASDLRRALPFLFWTSGEAVPADEVNGDARGR